MMTSLKERTLLGLLAPLALVLLLMAGCSGGGGGGGGGGGDDGGGGDQPPAPSSDTVKVLAANDLGMHCMDREFSVFSILPPFNVVGAQVVRPNSDGNPVVLGEGSVTLFYDGVADPNGSINTTSLGKTDFWDFANLLFGAGLVDGEGLTGLFMPADNPAARAAQSMPFSSDHGLFLAQGIPITPLDDALNTNAYPLLRVSAVDPGTGGTVGYLDIVVPVASETDCRTCHVTGAMAADDPNITWADEADKEVESKKNILILHDARQGTSLVASQPVLCAGCHYSPALDLTGAGPTGDQVGKPTFSNVMHQYHGQLTDGGGSPVFPPSGTVAETCYQCHPGKITQCLRGAMANGGMECLDCHGDMSAVGGQYPLLSGGSLDGTNDGQARRPWLDLPRCQSCHTGDAVSHLSGADLVPDPDSGGIRLLQAFRTGDLAASPLLADNKRFAENTNTLYRLSKGHGGLSCEGCHGSPHAVWPNAQASANDNLAAVALQGYAGKIMECTTCHVAGTLARTTSGPHGLHTVNDSAWYDGGHEDFYENNPSGCQTCHGLGLTGTPLSKTPVARTLNVEEERAVNLAMGEQVACDKCHEMPGGED